MSEIPYMLENTPEEFERARDVAARRHAAEARALTPPSAAVPDPADVEKAARALAEVLDRLGLDGMAEHEDLRDAAEAILLPALAAVRPSPDSEAVARAWDEGFNAGHDWWVSGMDGRPGDPPPNPYRAALGTGDREGRR